MDDKIVNHNIDLVLKPFCQLQFEFAKGKPQRA